MKRSILLLPALLIVGAASAQDSFDTHVADVGLLQAKVVQTDVGITAAQRTKMNAAAEQHKKRLQEYEKQLKALGTTSPDKRRLKGMFDILKKDVFAVMTKGQIKRLRELTLQRIGLISLTDDQVAAKVGLTPTQVGKIKQAFQAGRTKFVALQRSTAEPILAPYKDRKPKNAAEQTSLRKEIDAKLKVASVKVKPKLEAIGKETDAAMMAVLTAPQRAKWNALKGRPFKAK